MEESELDITHNIHRQAPQLKHPHLIAKYLVYKQQKSLPQAHGTKPIFDHNASDGVNEDHRAHHAFYNHQAEMAMLSVQLRAAEQGDGSQVPGVQSSPLQQVLLEHRHNSQVETSLRFSALDLRILLDLQVTTLDCHRQRGSMIYISVKPGPRPGPDSCSLEPQQFSIPPNLHLFHTGVFTFDSSVCVEPYHGSTLRRSRPISCQTHPLSRDPARLESQLPHFQISPSFLDRLASVQVESCPILLFSFFRLSFLPQ